MQRASQSLQWKVSLFYVFYINKELTINFREWLSSDSTIHTTKTSQRTLAFLSLLKSCVYF